MNSVNYNYPSTTPNEQIIHKEAATITGLNRQKKESQSSKAKRQQLKAIQKKLILALIFLSAITAYFIMRSKTFNTQVQALKVKEKLLEQHKKIFKNKTLKIINPRDGQTYTIEFFEAQVLMETKDSFYIKTFTEKPEVLLKPGGSYLWQDIIENRNDVPGHAFSVSMIFSRNKRRESTQHTFVLTDDRGTLFSPNFDKFTDNE